MLFDKPIRQPEEDRDLTAWQVPVHWVNHGTDHRAQVHRMLHDLGIRTALQDYIFTSMTICKRSVREKDTRSIILRRGVLRAPYISGAALRQVN